VEIQAFIFNWRGHEANALALEASIGRLVETTVINSDEAASGRHPGWVELGEEAYFSAQWNEALRRFRGDILFHIQADARFDDFEALLARMLVARARHRPGVFEPNVDFTTIRYDAARLRALEPQLYAVPLTDCTCWFIEADVLAGLPAVDLGVNKLGWGICAAVAAQSWARGRPCVRDYAFTIQHPRGRGYSSRLALEQRVAYLGSLEPALARSAARLYDLSARLRPSEVDGDVPPVAA